MKLINHHVEMWHQKPGLQGIYDMIEAAGKVTHEADPKGGETAKAFVDRLIKNKHYAMLEFGTVYFTMDLPWNAINDHQVKKYIDNPYSRVTGPYYNKENYEEGEERHSKAYITTNLRVLYENGWMADLKHLSEPTDYHRKRYTFKLYTDRAVSHEAVRHRTFSFAQESQRYCNYSKERFGNEVTFVIPSWSKLIAGNSYDPDIAAICDKTENLSITDKTLVASLCEAEQAYFSLLNQGLAPQDARAVLPNTTKTEIVMCGFKSYWKHFLDLRYKGTTGAPHPDMLGIAIQIHELLEVEGVNL